MKPGTILYMAAALMLMSGCSDNDDKAAFYEEMRAADKMVFATMAVSKTARIEDSEWYKVGKRIAVYSYDTYLQAYIDMSDISEDDIEFDDKARTVHITLPPVVIELAGRDMEMKKVYENVGIFRSEIDAKERAVVKEQANRSLKKELEENGEYKRRLTDAAERKARTYIENLFKTQGYTVTVDFGSGNTDYKSVNIVKP